MDEIPSAVADAIIARAAEYFQAPTLRQRYAMAALTGLCANPVYCYPGGGQGVDTHLIAYDLEKILTLVLAAERAATKDGK